MPAWLAPAIYAGGAALGAGINAWSANRQNRKSRQWSDKDYERRKQDNIRFWQMQNEYNDPAQQMSRLKAANLNPKLVYGGSSGGTAGTAGGLQSPDSKRPEFQTPRFGDTLANAGTSFMASMYDLQIKKQTVDNLKTKNTVELAHAALLAAQGDNERLKNTIESQLIQTSVDARKEKLRQTTAQTDYLLDENVRRSLMNSQSLAESAERILSSKIGRKRAAVEMRKMEKEIDLKQLEIDLRQMGINPNDSTLLQMLGRLAAEAAKSNNMSFGQLLKSAFFD